MTDEAWAVDESGLRKTLGKIGLWTNQLNALTTSQLRDTVQEIEALGFQTLWNGESALGKEAFTSTALMLGFTKRMVFATGVASIWARDAAATASAQRTLCEAFPRRFVLGLGVSHQGMVTSRGHSYRKPLTAMREYLRGIDLHPVGDVPQPPEPPPRLLAALGPGMLELARACAQGAHSYLVSPEHTRMAREILGPDRVLAPEQGVVLDDDPEVARSILRGDMSSRLSLPNYRRSLVRMGWSHRDLEGGGSDRLIDRMYVWGTEADVSARVEEHMEAGADHVALFVMRRGRGAPLEEWRRLSAMCC